MGFETEADASHIAGLMLEHGGDPKTLVSLTDWTLRRFNPAFEMLEYLFPDGRVRKTLQAEYSIAGYGIYGPGREALRKFIEV